MTDYYLRHTTLAYCIKAPDGSWMHQTEHPGTIDVWLMADWPLQVIHSEGLKPGDWQIWCCSVDATKLRRSAPKKKWGRAVSWPYTIDEADVEVVYMYASKIKKGKEKR